MHDSVLLSRHTHLQRPVLQVAGPMALNLGRVHELCGNARRTLALQVAACCTGPVIWIAPGWAGERLNGEGMCRWVDPGRLIFVSPMRAEDLLWSMEESLRSGAVALVVSELPEPPGLTPVRRLHLAAETGGEQGRGAPLGLLLTPSPGGAPGIESRWSLSLAHRANENRWELERLRARAAPPGRWILTDPGDPAATPKNRLRVETAQS
ncbi:MAG: protein ImuA [Paracoccaceae bacterium]|jgi:protein ImuA